MSVISCRFDNFALFGSFVELVVTGSNSHMLSSELGTYLSGRYIPIAVYPFSFSEFVEAYDLQPRQSGREMSGGTDDTCKSEVC